MNATETDLLRQILTEVQALSLGATVADGSITAVKLASDAVTTAKILDANVTTSKLASDAVTTAKILDANITTPKIADANVTTSKLASNAVTTAKILDANVTTAKIADANVTPVKLSQPFTRGTAVATISGTAIDFIGIPDWVKRITVMFNGVSTNGTSGGLVQVGAGSIDATGYTAQNGSLYSNTNLGAISSTSGFLFPAGTPSAAASGFITLSLFGSNTWVASGSFAYTNSLPNPGFSAGSKTLSGTLDRVRITTVNGTDTFDAGSVNILYE